MSKIDELPVPDWGLRCPCCGEPLVGQPAHRCGKCGEPFNILQVVACHRPIPDVGLHCPECSYDLTGLIGSRCPECGNQFSVQELLDEQSETHAIDWVPTEHAVPPHIKRRLPVFAGSERPLPDFGLLCAACEEPLVNAADDRCPSCGEAFDLGSLPGDRDWVEINDYVPVAMYQAIRNVLYGAEIPYLVGKFRSPTYDTGQIPLALPRIDIPREFFFDALYAMQEAMRPAAEFADDPWTCPACKQDVPAGFEICWSCGRPHPQAETETSAEDGDGE